MEVVYEGCKGGEDFSTMSFALKALKASVDFMKAPAEELHLHSCRKCTAIWEPHRSAQAKCGVEDGQTRLNNIEDIKPQPPIDEQLMIDDRARAGAVELFAG